MRLIFDIETSPNVVYSWRTGYKLNISPENIIHERAILCIAWKWEGQKRVHSLRWDDGDDEQMIRQFADVYSEATETVSHNGDKFDVPWLRGRCLKYGIVLPTVPNIDTCTQARRLFNLNAHKLDYIATYLGLPKKLPTSFKLWAACMEGSKSALQRMVTYCKQDVGVLEAVFEELKPHLSLKVHRGFEKTGKRTNCPSCASANTGRRARRISAAGLPKAAMNCRDCNKWWTLPESVFIKDTLA